VAVDKSSKEALDFWTRVDNCFEKDVLVFSWAPSRRKFGWMKLQQALNASAAVVACLDADPIQDAE
jgi:hypothetical protein